MALIKCPNCAGTVSTKAPACPHCCHKDLLKLPEKHRLEDVANEVGPMSHAIALQYHERVSAALEENHTGKNHPRSRTPEELNHVIVQWVICLPFIAMAGFYFYLKLEPHFRQPDTLRATPDAGNGLTIDPANWGLSGKELPERVTDLKTISQPTPPPFGTRREHYSLDQYLRLPKGNR